MPSEVNDDLTPGPWNFTRTRGDVMDATRFEVTVDGVPQVLAPVAHVVKERRTSAAQAVPVVLDLAASVDGNGIVVGAGVTLNVEAGTYWWDLEVNGKTRVGGMFRVLPDVSGVAP